MDTHLTDRYLDAKRLALAAMDLDESARCAMLEREIGDDAALRREVDWMIHAIERSRTATLPSMAPSSPDLSGHDAQATAPRQYRLLRRLGEGGMGMVYLAERGDGVFVQQVALKFLHAAAEGSPILLERFTQERRLLARLEHPGIARLLDGGVLEDGKPFLAMEYVEGERIDAWCDRHALDLNARIQLFLKVCDAVEYAHRNLIIHRDIKPANVLVTEAGEPKLLDFGIARIIDGETELVATATGHQALTLAYASPEQIERLPLTTAADVYSLGVVLYQLVAGKRPYQHLVTPRLLSNAIVSGDVLPPSRAARAASVDGEPSLAARSRLVPRDVDAIVLKALRRAADERYGSVAAFAADLRRHLDRRPVIARRGQQLYRARRFVQRNRWPLAAVSAVLLAVIVGLGASLHSLAQTRAARQLAEQRQAELQRMVDFQQSMLDSVDIDAMGNAMATAQHAQLAAALAQDPAGAPASAVLDHAFTQVASTDIARQTLDSYVVTHALDSLDREFADAPLVRADLRQSLARVLIGIGSYPHAVAELRTVLAARQRYRPDDATALLHTRLDLARALDESGDLAHASELYAQAAHDSTSRALADPLRVAAESGQARVLAEQGQLQAALLLQQSLEQRLRTRLPAGDPGLMRLRRDLVITLIGLGRRDEALAEAKPLVALYKATLGPEAPETLDATITLAKLMHYRNDYEQSLALAQAVAAVRERRLGAGHPDTLSAQHMVATDEVYLAQDPAAFARAGKLLQRVIDLRRQVLGPDHPDTVASMAVMVRLLSKQGNAAALPAERHRYMTRAIALERRILASHLHLLGESHPDTLMAQGSLANLLSYDGQYGEALAQARSCLAGQRRVLGDDHPIVFATYNLIGDIQVAAGHWSDARAPYERAVAGRERLLGVGDAHTIESASRLYEVLHKLGDTAAAMAVRVRYMDPVLAMDPATLNASMRSEREEVLSKL